MIEEILHNIRRAKKLYNYITGNAAATATGAGASGASGVASMYNNKNNQQIAKNNFKKLSSEKVADFLKFFGSYLG